MKWSSLGKRNASFFAANYLAPPKSSNLHAPDTSPYNLPFIYNLNPDIFVRSRYISKARGQLKKGPFVEVSPLLQQLLIYRARREDMASRFAVSDAKLEIELEEEVNTGKEDRLF